MKQTLLGSCPATIKHHPIPNDSKPVYIPVTWMRQCHISRNQSPAFWHSDLDSVPGQVVWDLRWTKQHQGMFSLSTLVSLASSYSANCSTFNNHPIIDAVWLLLNNQPTSQPTNEPTCKSEVLGDQCASSIIRLHKKSKDISFHHGCAFLHLRHLH